MRQARKDAELTASADSVRAYLKQIGKVALLNAEQEVSLAERIEAGLYAQHRLDDMERLIAEGDAAAKLSPAQKRDLVGLPVMAARLRTPAGSKPSSGCFAG